ncbi:Crp/Fnr family transcriptional regulator [Aquabacterium sp.]|uniref:Crp/Fnr family transcriptional regulator n=1 Tax=Aquabacterium sp. TaxID=1872578 RepID=UPI0024870194|nr:Crp/Fnr family transcriptional regulator [Aquabacterium sp.]MDI1257841.1 Crp/Fnr family transcriptional regulator [Aquabacterium sp.]
MRRLLDRFKSTSPGDTFSEREADDEGFFSTQFMERPETSRAASAWTSRALAVGAQSLDPQVGVALLLKAWSDDTFTSLMGEAECDKLRAHLEFVTVPAGRELIVQDEKGDYALVILEGLVAVDRVQPTGERARLAELREGDVLGEMSLLDAGSRFASCQTLSRCSLVIITRSALDEFAIEEPRLGFALMAGVARRLSLRMRQLSARLGALLTAG